MSTALVDTPLRTCAEELDRILALGRPTLVVFEGADCERCRALGPVLDAMALEFADRALLVRVADSDEAWVAARHHLVYLPTLAFWSAGREVARVVGAVDAVAIRAHLEFAAGCGPRPGPALGPRRTIRSGFGTRAAPVEPALLAAAAAAGGEPVSDSTFEALVLHATRPVLVTFWAPWCPSCQAMEPVVERLAADYGERIRFLRASAEEAPLWSGRLNVRGIPAFVLFRGGAEAERVVGVVAAERLAAALERML